MPSLPLVAACALALLVACGRAAPGDTSSVPLAAGTAGGQPWRLVGRRHGGRPCASVLLAGAERPAVERCGVQRTALRHLDPVVLAYAGRLLIFSPLPASARRVRLDDADGTIRIEPARTAPGFPAPFFVIDVDPLRPPLQTRAFANGGKPAT